MSLSLLLCALGGFFLGIVLGPALKGAYASILGRWAIYRLSRPLRRIVVGGEVHLYRGRGHRFEACCHCHPHADTVGSRRTYTHT